MPEPDAAPPGQPDSVVVRLARRLPAGVRRRIHALLARVAPSVAPAAPAAPVPTALPTELTERGSRRDVETPTGWTLAEVYGLLATLSIEKSPPAELEGYLREDFERFLITWSLVRECAGRALEIGANPYFTTVLLREFTDLELTLTNSFGSVSTDVAGQQVSYRDPRPGGVIDVDEWIEYRSLNVETADFPWPDEYFDVVVFCEVIEHLMADPIRVLNEIHRVLKPGGTLLVSTPNVAPPRERRSAGSRRQPVRPVLGLRALWTSQPRVHPARARPAARVRRLLDNRPLHRRCARTPHGRFRRPGGVGVAGVAAPARSRPVHLLSSIEEWCPQGRAPQRAVSIAAARHAGVVE